MFGNKGNTVVYAIILALLGAILGLILFSKSEILLGNLEWQSYNAKLNKNIQEKASLAIGYDSTLNTDGSGFTNTRSCPSGVTMSGTTASGVVETINTAPYFDGSVLYCSGMTASGNLLLTYSPDYTTFMTGTYGNTININPTFSTGTLTATFSDPALTYMSFSVPVTTSGIDANLNSDEYTANSTGSIRYPNGGTDNDATARKAFYGYVRKNTGWYNVFWNSAPTNAYIDGNTNNNVDLTATTLSKTQTGYLGLNLDNPYSLRVIEFDSGAYLQSKQLKRLSDTTYTSATGGIGWLQNDGTLSGGTIPGSSARPFDFQNRNYALFLSFSGNLTNTGVEFLKSQITGMNQSGSGLYLVPMDDSRADQIKYLGSDIIITDKNDFVSKQSEIIQSKPGSSASGGPSLTDCFFGIASFGCSF